MTSTYESYSSRINRDLLRKQKIVDVAAGRRPADAVLKNAVYLNVFANELCQGDIAIAEGLTVGMGSYSGETEYDMTGKIVLPGFVDSHREALLHIAGQYAGQFAHLQYDFLYLM